MNKLDEKIVRMMLTNDSEGLLEIVRNISYKISKGIGTFSEISRPFYVAILQQYADAFTADMSEAERELAEGLIKILNRNSTCVKFKVPSKEE